jgi:hypothetical protein
MAGLALSSQRQNNPNSLLVLRTAMYTQALNSGGGVAQRLNQHFFCPNPGPPGFCHKPLQPKGLQLFWFSSLFSSVFA